MVNPTPQTVLDQLISETDVTLRADDRQEKTAIRDEWLKHTHFGAPNRDRCHEDRLPVMGKSAGTCGDPRQWEYHP